MKLRADRFVTLTLVLVFFLIPLAVRGETAPTTTTLKVSSTGPQTPSVAPGSVITLTAKVKSGGTAVKVGQVNFCDAVAATCTDIHLLGMSQLTAAGTATLKFIPGIGKHSYRAVFLGTPNGTVGYGGSSSRDVLLLVSGKFPTATQISASGSVGDYSLTATVSSLVNTSAVAAPAGKVSFLDTSENNRVLGKAMLAPVTTTLDFLKSNNPSTNPYPQSVAVADFNGDGKLDLVVPVYSIFTPATDANILLGNGDGRFIAGPAFPVTGQNVNNAAVGDFNGDGKPDLALSLPDANQVQVLLGNGDGSFTAMNPISVNAIYLVATADVNGDGNADLIVVSPGAQAVNILLGNGDGTFRAGATVPISGSPSAVAIADFNGDGKPDLAVTDYSNEVVVVLLGKGDGTFAPVSSKPSTGIEPLQIAAGDFNGDGIPDLAVTNQNNGYPEPGTVILLLGKGDGTFTSTDATPMTGSIPGSVAIADFNGDGTADLITTNAGGNNATVLLGNGDGTFAAPLNPPAGTDPLGAGVGDFNGDGLPDLATGNNTTTSVTVLLTTVMQTSTGVATGISPKGAGQHLVVGSYKGSAIYSGSVSAAVSLTGQP